LRGTTVVVALVDAGAKVSMGANGVEASDDLDD
jgi:hypothetical protein